MPKSSTKIGKKIEAQLKEYLEKLAIIPKSFLFFNKDLRLMKSGKQSGIDLNWDLNFNLGGTDYKWYFESKGRGRSEYRTNKQYQNFTLSLISDKLLQLLGRADLNIDCWCLFAPYIRLDESNKREIEHIQKHLSFKLCIWDKDFLFPRIKVVHPGLFHTIYSRHHIKESKGASKTAVIDLDNYVWEIITDSIEGYFLKKIHERYRVLKRDVETKCNREMLFSKNPAKGYFFQYQGANYYIHEKHLTKAIRDVEVISLKRYLGDIKDISVRNMVGGNFKIKNLINIFDNALCEKRSLYRMLRDYLNDPEIPFARICVVFKISDFANLSFSKLDSSIHFGTTENKNLLFKRDNRYIL